MRRIKSSSSKIRYVLVKERNVDGQISRTFENNDAPDKGNNQFGLELHLIIN